MRSWQHSNVLAEAVASGGRIDDPVVVPESFLGFCGWLGVQLTPGQAEFARVAYDGSEPVDRGLAARIFGDDLPLGRRHVVAAVCGARAGKSYVLVALRLVHGMLLRDVSALPPGQVASALIIAPRDDLRREVFRYAIGAVQSKPELAAMLDEPPRVDTFALRRPDGARVEFRTGVATVGGTAARGAWWTDFALDECAFFRDSNYAVNDEELFRSGLTRLLPGGQAIVASTPWGEAGLLHQMWKSRPPNTIVAHAPTLLMHDSELIREVIASATRVDPDNARREYGAEFMTTGTSVFFEGASVDAALTEESFVLQPGDVVAAGGDFGFRSDSSALVLVAMRGNALHIFDGAEERPEDGKPLKPSVTVAAFAGCIKMRCSYLMADAHYREAIAEHLEEYGLVYAPAPMQPAESYVRARMLLREGRVKIHPLPFRERMVQQMREVHGKPTSGGGMSIIHPRWSKGGHGDIVAAMVLALWQVSGDAVAKPAPEQGTREWEQALQERRYKRWEDEQQRSKWAGHNASDRGTRATWRGELTMEIERLRRKR